MAGVKTHENGMFLYKSLHGDSIIRNRVMDYANLILLTSWLAGVHPLLWVPLAANAMFYPRFVGYMHYYTFHAELLPHTEQVVFHKTQFFGVLRRVYVDIKNLEKVDPELVLSPFLFQSNAFDPNLVFRDQETKEIFVFDSNGIWNEEALKHKLLY